MTEFVTEVSKVIECGGSNGPRTVRIPRGQKIRVVADCRYGVDRESNTISPEIYEKYYKPSPKKEAAGKPKVKTRGK